MAKVDGTVPNLINGISQQAPALRLPSQGEVSINYYPLVADGNIKRPPTKHNAVLAALNDTDFTHFIMRDDQEEYVVAINNAGTIRVWDFAGNEKTVTNSSPTYLAGISTAKDDIRALTVADHTFIVNRKKTVVQGTTKSPARPFEALIFVQAGNYGRTYKIDVNGVTAASYTVPDGSVAAHTANVDTVFIANQLFNGLVAASLNVSPWAVGRYHSTIYLRNNTNDFTLRVEDGQNGRAMKDVKKQVQKFSDLPQFGPDGTVIKVIGTDGAPFDDYWVEFQKDNDINSTGVWQESIAPDTPLGFDATTMPHILVREANGTFTFKVAPWEERKCGDLSSNPDPSFVGQTIDDLIFHRNRFGFLTKENVVLSETGAFYNFFRTTMTALLDTDPIDVAAAHTKVSILKHAVPFQDVLLVFSDKTQFRLSGNETLTPKTVSMKPLTELSAAPNIRPVVAASNIFFIGETGAWAQLYEYFLDKQFETADAEQVSAHAPSFVPSGVQQMAASPDIDMVLMNSSVTPSDIYLYKFFWKDAQTKAQSAWAKWTLPGADAIQNMAFDKTDLILLVRRAGVTHLERLNCEPGQKEKFHLDRRTEISSGVYNPTLDQTTFTVPYVVPSGVKVVTSLGAPVPGIELTVLSFAGTTVTVSGNWATTPVYVGIPYQSRYRFSQFYPMMQEKTKQDGRLQVLTLSVTYTHTAHFIAEVTPEGRATVQYPFNGRILGEPANMTGVIVVDEGRLSFPIMSRSDRIKIDLVSDSWLPCGFTGAEWRGNWNPHTRHQ